MKRIFTLMIFVLAVSLTVMAQENPKNEAGRLEAFKIAYLTKKLNLSPEEAQRFWPIYNKYQQELRTARVDNRQQQPNEIEREEKILNIRKKYNDEFSRALNKEKVNTLYKSEREFGAMVQKELIERRQQRMDNRKKKN
jgi:hypothetical protein